MENEQIVNDKIRLDMKGNSMRCFPLNIPTVFCRAKFNLILVYIIHQKEMESSTL